jgi:hypothetical protein
MVLPLGNEENRHRWLKCPTLFKKQKITDLGKPRPAEHDLVATTG